MTRRQARRLAREALALVAVLFMVYAWLFCLISVLGRR